MVERGPFIPPLHNLLHPLEGYGYQWWSGIGSDISEVTLIVGLIVFLVKHNCHERGCWRLSWHPDKSGHPVCKVHHPDHPARGWFRR